MPTDAARYDVAVLGGGNAALTAALTARRAGASVIVLECAPRELRGGNSRHTRNLRCAHDGPTDIQTESYSPEELMQDLVRVNGGRANETLAHLVVDGSADCVAWMRRLGARFQTALRGTLQLSRTNAFFLGGGKALMNTYYAAAERLGIAVCYDTEVVALRLRGDACESVAVRANGSERTIAANAFVLASGGFEANLDWLRNAWGTAADNFIVRGTPYNKGAILRMMIDAGAQTVGDPKDCHAVAIDGRAPKFDGGIATRLDSVPLGIVVNRDGERFHDEGEDFWPRRYAIWGKLVARQPGQIAYSIVDAKSRGRFIPSMYPPIEARSIAELAERLGVESHRLERTVSEFNAAVRSGSFDPTALDDCRTAGLRLDKTHWAQRLDTPPFWGYPLRPGITFTYLGLRIDASARVLGAGSAPFRNVYAAGEIMAGNVLENGYVAGIGMTIGTVFGRIAGAAAACHAAS
jgi:tricarballylate dehydrogenase